MVHDVPSSQLEPSILTYPVLLWRDGYIYLAKNSIELCAHPRSIFSDTKERAINGEWRLADSEGHIYQLSDFLVTKPFGGWKSIPYRLLFSIFAIPVGFPVHPPEIGDFKKTLITAVKDRYRFDKKSPVKEISRKIAKSKSYEEAMDAIPKL